VHDVDTVLGVSITGVSAGLVLLEGRTPDGDTVDRDAIDLTGAHASLSDVMAAVLGIQGSVSANGHRLRAVGVTWSAGSESKARELVTNLTEFGLTNIVTVRPAEATNSLKHNSPGGDDDTGAPAVDTGEADVAAANGDVPLARGAALALARHATAQSEHDESPRRGRRRSDPSSIAAATILCGGTLAVVLAAMWMGVGPRHADSDVAPPAPQPRSAPSQLQVPSLVGPTISATPERPLALSDSSQGAAPVDTPTPTTTPAASHQLVPAGVQHLPHRPAGPPPLPGQDPAADDAQGPPPGPEQAPLGPEQAPPGAGPTPPGTGPTPPGAEPAPDNPGPPPGDATPH
jgi:hypothetical protein